MGRQLTHRIEVKVCTNKRLANWEDVERNVALWKPPCFHVFWISVPQAYLLWAGLRGSSTVTLWTVFASALTTACPRTWAVLTCPYNLPALELMGNWLGRFFITHFRRHPFLETSTQQISRVMLRSGEGEDTITHCISKAQIIPESHSIAGSPVGYVSVY